ncbi:hypothetical protein ACU5AX_12205 [Sphingomonas sp. XXL09]
MEARTTWPIDVNSVPARLATIVITPRNLTRLQALRVKTTNHRRAGDHRDVTA